MIHVGQKVRFDALAAIKQGVERQTAYTVGTVVWINARHGWFSVQHGNGQRISFFFSEIGKKVTICG